MGSALMVYHMYLMFLEYDLSRCPRYPLWMVTMAARVKRYCLRARHMRTAACTVVMACVCLFVLASLRANIPLAPDCGCRHTQEDSHAKGLCDSPPLWSALAMTFSAAGHCRGYSMWTRALTSCHTMAQSSPVNGIA
jgi:hypothetical protein